MNSSRRMSDEEKEIDDGRMVGSDKIDDRKIPGNHGKDESGKDFCNTSPQNERAKRRSESNANDLSSICSRKSKHTDDVEDSDRSRKRKQKRKRRHSGRDDLHSNKNKRHRKYDRKSKRKHQRSDAYSSADSSSCSDSSSSSSYDSCSDGNTSDDSLSQIKKQAHTARKHSDEKRMIRNEDKNEDNRNRRRHSHYKERSSSRDRNRRKRKNNEKEKKTRKKEKKKKKKRKKKKRSSYSSDEDSNSNENDKDVRRSAISGKKIKMHIEKTEDDLVREQARKSLLQFMNSSIR